MFVIKSNLHLHISKINIQLSEVTTVDALSIFLN